MLTFQTWLTGHASKNLLDLSQIQLLQFPRRCQLENEHLACSGRDSENRCFLSFDFLPRPTTLFYPLTMKFPILCWLCAAPLHKETTESEIIWEKHINVLRRQHPAKDKPSTFPAVLKLSGEIGWNPKHMSDLRKILWWMQRLIEKTAAT